MKRLALNYLIIATVTVSAAFTACNSKKSENSEQTGSDSTRIIDETCLIFIQPERKTFEDEKSPEAEVYYIIEDDRGWYTYHARTNFEKLGVEEVRYDTNERYLSFVIDNGKNYVVDTKKDDTPSVLLYKKGKKPISVVMGYEVFPLNYLKEIAEYLEMDIKDAMKRLKCELEVAIIQVVELFQNKDEISLNKLFLMKDFGISFVYTPGMAPYFKITDKLSFGVEIADRWILNESVTKISDAWLDVRFEELPQFDCDKEKWNKQSGVYCDTTYKAAMLAAIAERENEWLKDAGEAVKWSIAEIKRFEEIGKTSHKILAIDEDGTAFCFILTRKQGRWYLTTIIRIEPCSA